MVTDTLVRLLQAIGDGSETSGESQKRITFDGGTDTDGVSVSKLTGVSPDSIDDIYGGTDADEELRRAQADHLDELFTNPDAAIGNAATLGRRHADAELSGAVYAATYGAAFEEMTEKIFDRLAHRLGDDNEAVSSELQRAQSELVDGIWAGVSGMQAGLEAHESSRTAGADEEFDVDDDDLLDGLGVPVFMICSDAEVRAWNSAIENLTGVTAEEASEFDDVSEAFYSDGRRTKTLAEKVVEAPENADEVFDVERADAERTLYRDEGTMVAPGGEERKITFAAKPIYEDGELKAVVETVRDRTEDVRRHESVTALVEEVGSTLTAMRQGDLSARADFTDEHGVLDEQLVGVADQVDDMAERFETLAMRVDDQASELADSVEEASTSAHQIEDRVDEQTELLSMVATEMENFSASMQEVAASSDQVASAAEQAKAAADSGLDSSEGAREATEEVIEMSDDLVETVTELESQMTEIEGVVEVIAEVADQTNLLALNANIEAARAGEAGSGFEVVADEVKELANETREHTEEIAERIEEIQSQANETVVAVEESNEQVQYAGSEIEDALIALEEIADAVDEAATGVTEVAEANDEQAQNVEQVMATVEDVRDTTGEVQEATEDIVDASREQTTAINELAERVDDLTAGSAGEQQVLDD
ncbi:methyl-accepting chemotaxis protein [Halomicrococcus sp. SG-WS-1]|uniref:methyl-accepting chemotaxis protein n=1 Tax=Halomicrococcus sp. SG-WS-1 TaxID=3439057 RepID=UPI003F7B0963